MLKVKKWAQFFLSLAPSHESMREGMERRGKQRREVKLELKYVLVVVIVLNDLELNLLLYLLW